MLCSGARASCSTARARLTVGVSSKSVLGAYPVLTGFRSHCWVSIAPFAFRLDLFGAGEGIRTLDPNLGKVVLYP